MPLLYGWRFKLKTHYYPYGFYEDEERAPCGTWFGDESSVSVDWKRVTCGHCKRRKSRIIGAIADTEKDIVDQMGDMADFMAKQAV